MEEFTKVKQCLATSNMDDDTFEAARDTCLVLGGKLGAIRLLAGASLLKAILSSSVSQSSVLTNSIDLLSVVSKYQEYLRQGDAQTVITLIKTFDRT